jgi:hypothetical protein
MAVSISHYSTLHKLLVQHSHHDAQHGDSPAFPLAQPMMAHRFSTGHVPMLADPAYAALVQEIGLASLHADDKMVSRLGVPRRWMAASFSGPCRRLIQAVLLCTVQVVKQSPVGPRTTVVLALTLSAIASFDASIRE